MILKFYMATFTISALAVSKIVLHACKYPHAAVNGVLLTEKPPASSGCSESQQPVSVSPIVITDAVPLFHTNLNLAPMLEAALMRIDSCNSDKVIAGYYQANELLTEISPEGVGAQIYHRIADNCPLPKCLYALVDNAKIDRDCHAAPLNFYQRREAGQQHHRLEQLPAGSVVIDNEAECLEKLAALLHGQVYRALVDFDNHLDNIALDWSNARVAKQILG